MRLIEIKNLEERYQSFVRANGSFLQDWDWGDFQASLGKKVLRYIVEDNGEIVLSLQAVLSRVRGKVYLFAPYGPVFKSSVSTEEASVAFEFLAAELGKNFDLIFLRFEPMRPLAHMAPLKKTLDINPHQTLVLDLSKDPERLLSEMHPKTRYNIKVARKHGVEIKILEQIEAKNNPFAESAKRAGIKSYEVEYYNKMLAFFASGKSIEAKLYTAWHGNDLLAANLMLFWNGMAVYLFGGSVEHKRNMMPAYLLHWQAISDAKQKNLRIYDFWGVETDPKHPWYGFSKFKLGWGGEIRKYEGTWDYVLQPAWYNAYKVFRTINRKLR